MKYLFSFILFGTLIKAAPTNNEPFIDPSKNVSRAQEVKNAFLFAWHNYELYAFGKDELRPVTKDYTNSRNGWGATLVDALDTLYIMGLKKEFNDAIKHVETINWKISKEPSKTFETNIRYLGGLLSAYELDSNPILLQKAISLADDIILPSFKTKQKIPSSYVNVETGEPVRNNNIYLAEFGSLQLELVRLSQLTGNNTYAEHGIHIIEKIAKVKTDFPGLYPMEWDLETFTPKDSVITISGGSDSYYEYLLKTHMLMNGEEELQINLWKDSVNSMQKYLRSSTIHNKVFLGEISKNLTYYQTGELVCFIPGNILLGAYYLNQPELINFATELMDGCYDSWKNMDTGLAPESWTWVDHSQDFKHFSKDIQLSMETFGIIPETKSYDLRPETIESLFYFYRLTGDPIYQDKAYSIFQAIEKYCKATYGYSRITDVTDKNIIQWEDFEESYLFAETFKYLYLIFSDRNLISLDEYTFNTEGHPFKLPKPVNVQQKSF
ncbi:unnamed protein product [Cunninghamella blakesleeana]